MPTSPAFKKNLIAQAVVLSLALPASMPALATIPDSCVSAGLTTISSTVNNTCVLGVGSATTLEVTSSGGIVAAGNGVSVYGAGVSITNAGTIDAVIHGIGVYSTPTVPGGSLSDGISNSGTISGDEAALYFYNLTPFTVTNTGILDGEIRLGVNTLDLNGDSGKINGDIFGEGTINVNGTLVYDTKIWSNIGGNMTVNVNAGGTLGVAPGHLLTLYDTTTYTQAPTGTFQTGVSSDTSYGRLLSHGIVNLPDDAKINVDVLGSASLTPGLVLTEVISAGTLNATTFSVTDNSALFDFSAARNGNAVDLTIIATNASPTLSSVIASGNAPAQGAAEVFDSLLSTRSPMAPVITALGELATDQEVSDAVSKTLPLMTTGVKAVTLTGLHTVNRVIESRIEHNLGLSSGDTFEGDRYFWLKPVGSWADQDDLHRVTGYEASSYGIVVGADRDFSDTVRAGMAFAYMNSNVDSNSDVAPNSAQIDGYRLIGYASYRIDEATEANVQVDFGTSQTRGDRIINFAGISRAESDYDSWNAHIGAGIGRSLPISAKTTITPSVRVDYTYIEDEAYTETGAGVLNLSVAENDVDELLLYAEGELAHELGASTQLLANLGVGYDVLAGQDSVTAAFAGGGGNFITEGLDPSPWLARAGLGLVTNSKNVEFTARYDVEFRERANNQTLSVKFKMPF